MAQNHNKFLPGFGVLWNRLVDLFVMFLKFKRVLYKLLPDCPKFGVIEKLYEITKDCPKYIPSIVEKSFFSNQKTFVVNFVHNLFSHIFTMAFA